MDSESQKYAQLSQGAYDGSVPDGFDVDTDLSNRNRTVYVNRESGKATIAFRGTDLKSKSRSKDIGTDILLATGLQELSSRFRNSKKVARAAVQKYGQGMVDTTGHSLGSSQSLYVNSKLGLPSVSFNPGASPGFVKKTLFDRLSGSLYRRPVKKNAVIFTTGSDPISMLSPMMTNAKTVFVPKKHKSSHSLKNFLP